MGADGPTVQELHALENVEAGVWGMSGTYNPGQRSTPPPRPVGSPGPTLTMSLVREYRNIQSRVMLSFSRMSYWAVRVSPVPCRLPRRGVQGPYCRQVAEQDTLCIYFSVTAPSLRSHFTDGANKGQKE